MKINLKKVRRLAIRRAMHILGDTLEWETPTGGIWDETGQTEEVRDLTWALQACLDPNGMVKDGMAMAGVARFLEREGAD